MIGFSTRELRRLALVCLTLGVAACGSDTAPTETPDPVAVTETFSGSLGPNDAESYPFTSGRGTVSASIATLAPDSTGTIGFSLGTWNGLSCAVVLANDKATQGSSILGSVNGTGSLCVRVYDVGTITETVTYDVRVIHY
jgi:hypothetical protein